MLEFFVANYGPVCDTSKVGNTFSSSNHQPTRYHQVANVTIMMDKLTGRSRGFGFVTFEEDASVERIFREQEARPGPFRIGDHFVDVKRAFPKAPGTGTSPALSGGGLPGGGEGASMAMPRGGFGAGILMAQAQQQQQQQHAASFPRHMQHISPLLGQQSLLGMQSHSSIGSSSTSRSTMATTTLGGGSPPVITTDNLTVAVNAAGLSVDHATAAAAAAAIGSPTGFHPYYIPMTPLSAYYHPGTFPISSPQDASPFGMPSPLYFQPQSSQMFMSTVAENTSAATEADDGVDATAAAGTTVDDVTEAFAAVKVDNGESDKTSSTLEVPVASANKRK